MYEAALYTHKLLAYSWIGGSIMLFAMGIYFRDKATLRLIYQHIGPFYGYFEMLVLAGLITTGLYFFNVNNFLQILLNGSELAFFIKGKIAIALLILITTFIHVVISFKTVNKDKTMTQKIVSRISSMMILFLNLSMIYVAMRIGKII